MASLHEGGGPHIGEVTCGGSPHLSCKRDQIKMRDYVDWRVTHQSGLSHLPGVPHLHVNRLGFLSMENHLVQDDKHAVPQESTAQ